MDDLRYPVGRFHFDPATAEGAREQAIESIAAVPDSLRAAVQGLREEQLDTPYRPGGWTVRQLVHHVADSHVNAYTRFRLTLTEEEPLLRTYDEKAWAELEDARSAPIEISLALLDLLHERWVRLLRSLRPEDMRRAARHPDHGVMTMDHLLQQYAWHGRHHVAHIARLRVRENW
jgi:uncharacterized damage-inducible protein DinB